MNKCFYIIICMFLFLIIFPGCGDDNNTISPTPTPTTKYYTVNGWAGNPSGTKVIPNALCILENTDGTGYQASTTSDPNGAYSFANVPAGNYKIRTTLNDYIPFSCYFTLNKNTLLYSVLVTSSEWQSAFGTTYPYDPNLCYLGVYTDVDGTGRHEANANVSVSLTAETVKDGENYKKLGYMKDDGTIDWNATSTYGKGIGVWYDVVSNKTYTISGQHVKDSKYTFSSVNNVTTKGGEFVTYIMQGNTGDPNNVPTKMSDFTFLTQDKGYKADGSSSSNPLISDSDRSVSHTYGTVNYKRKKLTSNTNITFDGNSYTVYSSVPDYMTIPVGYKNEGVNGGNETGYADGNSAYSGAKIRLADSKYYIPYISGVTDNVAWTVDPYKDNKTYTMTASHKLQNGWAFDPGKEKAAIIWQNLDPNGGKPQGTEPTKVMKPSPDDHLLDTIKFNYDPNCIDPNSKEYIINSDYPYKKPLPWLSKGAFVPYQPMPGFQVNLLRSDTPWGTWNLVNNTCGLFVRKEGQVEIPVDDSGKVVPLVVQTWTDQMFTILNRTGSPIPETNDLFPGDEKYYLGNTYLPNEAGVITRWVHYPHMYYPKEPSRIDERDADGWLGYKGDKQEDVMAWNDAGGDAGGQGRKPYMLGAAKYTTSAGDTYKLRFEHSNTFWYNRDQNDAANKDKVYKGSLYLDGGSGKYYKICSIWWTWTEKTSFKNNSGTYCWTSDSGGCWVAHMAWNYNPDPNDPNNPVIPGGWVYTPYDPNKPAGNITLAGPSGSSLSLTCTRADLPLGAKAQEIKWVDPGVVTDNDPSGGGPVYKYTMTAVSRVSSLKFLIVLEDN